MKKVKNNLKKIIYNLEIQRYKNLNPCLISTMPKSGTWYCHYFFWTLNKILENKNFDINKYEFKGNFKIKNNHFYKKSRILIGHASCPGYEEIKDEYKKIWHKKKYWTDGYVWVNQIIGSEYNPNTNNKLKIVYIYREPLSQFLSSFKYNQNHSAKDQAKQKKIDFRDFCFKSSAVDSYIKHFHTFKVMKIVYPDNILLIKYEDLISKPFNTFSKILYFFNILNDDLVDKKDIEKAIKFVSKDNLKRIENKMGRSLANDGNKNSHIQSYSFAEVNDYLKKDDINKINSLFREFSYNLNN